QRIIEKKNLIEIRRKEKRVVIVKEEMMEGLNENEDEKEHEKVIRSHKIIHPLHNHQSKHINKTHQSHNKINHIQFLFNLKHLKHLYNFHNNI
ncbi:hypothetical protein, partial [Staphylococcus haemolyticus]|uniref:hypothetical protein n=1 Tax=Staphylococcus haemolyticus TaxID=1283 RepID=UPI001C930D43